MTLDILAHILIDPGFAQGYLGEALNVLVNGVPL